MQVAVAGDVTKEQTEAAILAIVDAVRILGWEIALDKHDEVDGMIVGTAEFFARLQEMK